MKVIRRANQPVTCPKCNAELEIEGDDIEVDDTGLRPAFYVLCPSPCCNHAIDVSQQAKILGASA